MSRRMIGVLLTCVIGVSGVVWLSKPQNAAIVEGQPTLREAPISTAELPEASLTRPSTEGIEVFSETELDPNAGTRTQLALYGDLAELERAANSGNASAQFRLSRVMRNCAVVMSFSLDSIASVSDPIRREYLQERWNLCQHFKPQKEDLLASSEAFERKSLTGGDPSARAMDVAMQVARGTLDQQEAWERMRPLLSSRDPYVFWAVSLVSMDENGETPESAAWRMLSCENGGPPEICTIMNGDIADACTRERRCGNTGPDISIDQYYFYAHPELYDLARGRAMELRDQFGRGRYAEISIHVP